MPTDTLDIGCPRCWATYTVNEQHDCPKASQTEEDE